MESMQLSFYSSDDVLNKIPPFSLLPVEPTSHYFPAVADKGTERLS